MNNFQLISRTIKEILKKKRVSYSELADKIGMSESSVKRILNANDVTISKLNQIAEALDVSFFEIINLSTPNQDIFFTLNPEQEKYLSKHLNYLVVFAEIAGGMTSPAQLKKMFNIDDKRLFEYLKKFDDMGLIELGANNKFKFLLKGQWNIERDGSLAQTMIDEGYKGFYNTFLKKMGSRKNAEYISSTQQVTKESYEKYKQALKELNKEFRLNAQRDSVVHEEKDLVYVTTIQGSAIWEPFEHLRRTLKF